MQINKLLHQSICDILHKEIQTIKDFWKQRNSPAFIRIEGGHIRRHFISSVSFGMPLSDKIPPEQAIEWLAIPEQQRKDMLSAFQRMLPGSALILLDTDSDDFDARASVWFIA